MSRAPSYRERLRVEGAVLAGCGAAGSLGLLAAVGEATRRPASTVVQLLVVALLLAALGPLLVRRALDGAGAVSGEPAGDGEPTPLWQLPLIVAGLAAAFGLAAGWDAGLRVTGGCLLVGLAQALLLERIVAARERREGATYVRMPGSTLVRTRLASVPAPPGPHARESISGR